MIEDREFAMGILEKYKPEDYDESRKMKCVEARRLAMIELRYAHNWAIKRIAKAWGFDHSTVINMLKSEPRKPRVRRTPQSRKWDRPSFVFPDIPGVTRPFDVMIGDKL